MHAFTPPRFPSSFEGTGVRKAGRVGGRLARKSVVFCLSGRKLNLADFGVAIPRFFHIFSIPLRNGLLTVTYSIIETGGKQYRVKPGDTLEVERLEVEAGNPVTFDRVLLVSNDGKVTVGAPTVANATVTADVVSHIRGEKKLTFKMKRRKGYHKTIGHRQQLTVVKIKEIKA
jgi:large subunit ribosomal protein L21